MRPPLRPNLSLKQSTFFFNFFVAVCPFQIVLLFSSFFPVFLAFDAYVSIWIDISKREGNQICSVMLPVRCVCVEMK